MGKKAIIINCLWHQQQDLDKINRIFEMKMVWFFLINTEDKTIKAQFSDPDDNSNIVLSINTSYALMRNLKDSYMVEIRRGYINDIFMTIYRYNILVKNIIEEKENIFPEFSNENTDMAIAFLNKYLSKPDKEFVGFLRYIRNSLIHYDGNHNEKNKLNHEFAGRKFITTPNNIGKQITYSLAELVETYKTAKRIVSFENLIQNDYFKKQIE